MLQLSWNSEKSSATGTLPFPSILKPLEIDFLEAEPHIRTFFIRAVANKEGEFDSSLADLLVHEFIKGTAENVFARYGRDIGRSVWLESVLKHYAWFYGAPDLNVTDALLDSIGEEFLNHIRSYKPEEIIKIIQKYSNEASRAIE